MSQLMWIVALILYCSTGAGAAKGASSYLFYFFYMERGQILGIGATIYTCQDN